MLLPHTYLATLLVLLFSMLCWGSWANTQKMSGKWRFELFYFDYAFGVLLVAIVCAFTFGTLGYDGFSFLDDMMNGGKRYAAMGFAAGMIFNLANMLLVAAIAVAGLSVAFPVGIGLALIIGVVWNYLIRPQGNAMLLFVGCALVVGAIIVDAIAYKAMEMYRAEMQAQAGKAKSTRKKVSMKGVFLSLASGVLMGSFYPLVVMAKSAEWGGTAGENGLGPYAIGFVFAMGVFLSTFVFNLFFMNLPVEGEPLEFLDYFKGLPKQHLLGVVGGIIWCAGAIANFVGSSAPEGVQVGPAISLALGQGAAMVSALWGLLLWKEFAGADSRVKSFLIIMFVLFVTGLAMISVAPLFAPQ
ncbi:MAG: AcrB/AcrD/AcrF family protein [Bryobacteraceae bacterium]|jgi:glucose uptake protein